MLLSNTSPEVIIKLAQEPPLRVPTSLDFPIIAAGIVVSAASAFSLERPRSMAFIRFALKSLGDFKEKVVKAKLIPLSTIHLGLDGA